MTFLLHITDSSVSNNTNKCFKISFRHNFLWKVNLTWKQLNVVFFFFAPKLVKPRAGPI